MIGGVFAIVLVVAAVVVVGLRMLPVKSIEPGVGHEPGAPAAPVTHERRPRRDG